MTTRQPLSHLRLTTIDGSLSTSSRLLIIIGVVLVSGAVAFLTSAKQSQLLLLLAGGLVVFAVFLKYPQLGLLAIFPTSLIIPFEIDVGAASGLNATLVLLILLIGVWFFDMFARQRRLHFISSRTLWPLLVLAIITVIAFLFGQLPWYQFVQNAPITAQLGGVGIIVISIGTLIVVAQWVTSLKWLERMTWLFLGLGGIFVATQMLPFTKSLGTQLYHYGALTSMFWTWMVALSLGQALYNEKLSQGVRGALFALALGTFVISYFIVPGWKSGWVPALATIGMLLALHSRGLRIAIIIGGLAAIPFLLPEFIASDEYSYSTRTEAWLLIAEIVKVNPILGLGPANYYWYTPLFPIRGYAVQFNSHNQFVDLVAQIGLVGLGCFLWFIFEITRVGWNLRTRAPDGFAKAYVYACLGGLAGSMVAAMFGDWVLPFVYNVGFIGFRASIYVWVFLGGLVAIEQMVSTGQLSQAPTVGD